MNIGIDIRSLLTAPRTGVGEYAYELLNAIFQSDEQNQYFLFYPRDTRDINQNLPKWDKTNIHFVTTNWPNKTLNICQRILKRPRLDKLTNKSLNYFFSPNLNFTTVSKHAKFILTIHDLSFEIFSEFFSAKQRCWHKIVNPKKQCQRADIILTPSENTKRDIINYYGVDAKKIKVIYPGLSSIFAKINNEQLIINKIANKQKYSLPDNFILFLGTIEPRKNIIGLIEAYEQACPLLPTPHSLIIAGAKGWHTKEIYERTTKSPLRENIKFIGYVDANDKPALYSAASLFVYPSFYEGFGFPVLEAMSCGAPVITSNRSSLPEITERAAYLINPNKPSEITKAIIELLSKEKLRAYFKNKGTEQAKKISWEKAAREWLEIVNCELRALNN